MKNQRNRAGIRPIQILPLSFLAVILLGSVLLALPASRADGVAIPYFDALFTATSATCVTGLTVVTTAEFSVFGQVVILCLMQIGGLGIMVLTAGLFRLVGKRTSLFERMTIAENLGESSLYGLRHVALSAVKYTFAVEAAGALLLMLRFIPQYGRKGFFYGIFHSVSAFCNAGFDLLGSDSLMGYVGDPLVSLVIMALIVLGGIGFAVALESGQAILRKKVRMRFVTKLVLLATAVLIVTGTVLTLVFEWANPDTLGPLTVPQKILAAAFQSVTLRTAGFATIDQALMTEPTKLFGILWMLIGGSPAGTAGGLKTTTFVVLFCGVLSVLRGEQYVRIRKHSLSRELVFRALAIVTIALLLICMGLFVFCLAERASGFALLDGLYELVSAVCTVGLSVGISAAAGRVTQLVLILLMFIGRVGMITFALSLTRTGKAMHIHYPEENIPIG